MPPPPASRYRPPLGRGRRALLAVLAALAYAGALGLTVVALRDLEGWGVLGAGALGLLVALLVVVGRTAVAALRPDDGGAAPPQGGHRARR